MTASVSSHPLCEAEPAALTSLRLALSTRSLYAIALELDLVGLSDTSPIDAKSASLWGIDPTLYAAGARLWLLDASRGVRILGVDEAPGAATAPADLWAMMRASRRHNPETFTLWVAILNEHLYLATSRGEDVTFLRVHLDRPRRGALARLVALATAKAQGAGEEPWRDRVVEVLDQERLTRRFYEGFVAIRQHLAATMRGGPREQSAREAIALTLLLRLIVLYFLQGRGALDGDLWFLQSHLDRARRFELDPYEALIRPLCFGALSLPEGERSAAALKLGRIPFLNGGLFEPTLEEREHPGLAWPREVWEQVFEGFFERYSFALREPLSSERAADIDPEVIGRVFEGLMCQSHRSHTGAFYTPEDLVRRIVAQSLRAHLAEAADVEDHEALARLIEFGDAMRLSEQERGRLGAALASVTILDPAVGTGAFLLEALTALQRCWAALDELGHEGALKAHSYEGARELVHAHLYGVDVNATAVRLCELRLWLNLLALLPGDLSDRIETIQPLPNLGHRLAIGDSLIGPCEVTLFGARRQAARQRPFKPSELKRLEGADASIERDATRRLQRHYLCAHGAEKARAQRQLEAHERDRVVARYRAHQRRAAGSIEELEFARESPDLFGHPQGLKAGAERELLMLYRERDALKRAIGEAERGDRAPAFSYEARFGEVMSQGGFDLIVTNPPWVRATAVESCAKGIHAARYRSAQATLWRGAKAHGVRATFGAQADLSALFLERSLELLRPGGRLGALVPAKLFRSLHGAALRGVLAEHHVLGIEDLSEAQRSHFDAAAYPALLEVRRRRPGEPGEVSCEVVSWSGSKALRHSAPVGARSGSTGEILASRGGSAAAPWASSASGSLGSAATRSPCWESSRRCGQGAA